MKTTDPVRWSQVEQDLRDHGEDGEVFVTLVEFWAQAAETMLDEGEERNGVLYRLTPAEAIRKAMGVTEATIGVMDSGILAKALTVFVLFWEHGGKLGEDLTPIEGRLVSEQIMKEIAHSQEEAAKL